MLEYMKVLILYRPDSDHESDVLTFVHDLRHTRGIENDRLELVSVNTRDGSATASLYDVMSYPSILVLANDGSVLNMWQGVPLPLMDEVMGYLYA